MELKVFFEENKKVNASINGQIVKTDQPVGSGGDGSAPSPFDLFLASIGTCAGIYVKGFCQQRGISTDNIKIIQRMQFNTAKKLIDDISIEIRVPADFPEQYKEAVIKAADLCTVKRHLAEPPIIKTSLQIN